MKTTVNNPHDDSSKHRIEIDQNDVELLKNHIINNLIPVASLSDIISVLSEIHYIIGIDNIKNDKRKVRQYDNIPMILWIILDIILPHACNDIFWQYNNDQSYLPIWRKLFELMRILLPINSIPTIPTYTQSLISKLRNNEKVEFWGMVVAAHTLVPTIVEQYVNFEDRQECRKILTEKVRKALNEVNEYDLENDYDYINYWHDEFEYLPDECKDYEKIFPYDKPIKDWEKLEGMLEDYPRIEEEPDYYDTRSSSDSSSFNDIKAIFEDL